MNTADLEKMPSWAKFLLTISVPIATGLIGYGELRARVEGAQQTCDRQISEHERRIDKLETAMEEDRREMARSLLIVRESIGNVQIDLARICARVKCEGGR